VLIDRQSGTNKAMAEAGYRLHAIYTLTELLDRWEKGGILPKDDLTRTRRFLVESV
jgi:orotate phosphoribosyltransferase